MCFLHCICVKGSRFTTVQCTKENRKTYFCFAQNCFKTLRSCEAIHLSEKTNCSDYAHSWRNDQINVKVTKGLHPHKERKKKVKQVKGRQEEKWTAQGNPQHPSPPLPPPHPFPHILWSWVGREGLKGRMEIKQQQEQTEERRQKSRKTNNRKKAIKVEPPRTRQQWNPKRVEKMLSMTCMMWLDEPLFPGSVLKHSMVRQPQSVSQLLGGLVHAGDAWGTHQHYASYQHLASVPRDNKVG